MHSAYLHLVLIFLVHGVNAVVVEEGVRQRVFVGSHAAVRVHDPRRNRFFALFVAVCGLCARTWPSASDKRRGLRLADDCALRRERGNTLDEPHVNSCFFRYACSAPHTTRSTSREQADGHGQWLLCTGPQRVPRSEWHPISAVARSRARARGGVAEQARGTQGERGENEEGEGYGQEGRGRSTHVVSLEVAVRRGQRQDSQNRREHEECAQRHRSPRQHIFVQVDVDLRPGGCTQAG